jgi:signal transduction histidine kinase/FixJ family two-component response regulator
MTCSTNTTTFLSLLFTAMPYNLYSQTAVYLLFHYYTRHPTDSKQQNKRNQDRLRAHVAATVLFGTFTYHMAVELIGMVTVPGYAATGAFKCVKAAVFGLTGLVAAGAFRQEIDAKEVLEKMVEARAKEINEQESELRMVGLALEASETAIAILDSKLRILWLNPALRRLSGKEDGDLHNRTLTDALGLSSADTESLGRVFLRPSDETILVNGKTISVEVSSPAKDVLDKSSESRFVVVLKDITENQALEKARQAAKQEALQAKAMAESMEVLSHELRTPLQGIMGMTSLMIETSSNLPLETKDSLTLVMVSSRLLLTLINNILDVRKCDADMMNEFPLAPVLAGPPLADAAAFCKPLASVSGIQLELQFDNSAEAIVMSDALRLQQILINLVSNAVKHSPPNSKISVRSTVMELGQIESLLDKSLACGQRQITSHNCIAYMKSRALVVSVCDEGVGIDSKHASSMFKKFTMLQNENDSTKTTNQSYTVGQPSGTGLGLNLCLKFIQRMNGNIWVTNNEKKGCCFSFYVPKCGRAEKSIGMGGRNAPDQQTSIFHTWRGALKKQAKDPSEIKLLVVDDTLINLKVLDRMLQRVGVGKVVLVDSGAKAIKALKESEENPYDLVITDIQMPIMSGTEFSATVRDSPGISYRPIIVGLTAETSQDLERRCLESGMVYVLHKPVTTDQLEEFLYNILNMRPAIALTSEEQRECAPSVANCA